MFTEITANMSMAYKYMTLIMLDLILNVYMLISQYNLYITDTENFVTINVQDMNVSIIMRTD